MDTDDGTDALVPEIQSDAVSIDTHEDELWYYVQVLVYEYRRATHSAFEIREETRLVLTVCSFVFSFTEYMCGISVTVLIQLLLKVNQRFTLIVDQS